MCNCISGKIADYKIRNNIANYVHVLTEKGEVYLGVLNSLPDDDVLNITASKSFRIEETKNIDVAMFQKKYAGKTEKEEGKRVNYTLLGNACVTMEDGTIYDGKLAIKDDWRGAYSIITDTKIIELSGYGIQELKFTPSKGRQIYDTINVNEKEILHAGCGWKLDDEHSPVIVAYGKVNYTPINKKEMKVFEVRFKDRSIPNTLIEAEKFDTSIKDCYAFKVDQEIVSIVDRGSVLGVSIKERIEPHPHKEEKATETR